MTSVWMSWIPLTGHFTNSVILLMITCLNETPILGWGWVDRGDILAVSGAQEGTCILLTGRITV